MRKYLFILLILLSFGLSQNKVNINNLVQYGNKMFEENDDKPYSGRVFDLSKSTGNKILEGRYKDGLMFGKWTEWYDNGQVLIKEEYNDGLKNGRFNSWFENGQKWSEGTFINGKENGLWTYWYENGKKKKEKTYKDGKSLDGVDFFYYDNGQKKYEDNYENEIYVDSKFFNKNGSFKKDTVNSEKFKYIKDGRSYLYVTNDTNIPFTGIIKYEGDEDGNLMTISVKEGKHHGRLLYFKNGVIHSLNTFKNHKPEGLWFKKNDYEGIFKNGVMIGFWTFFDYGNKYLEINIVRGYDFSESVEPKISGYDVRDWIDSGEIIVDRETEYYCTGVKSSEGTYKNGKRDGLWMRWFENGQKQLEGTFINGKENGLWTFWSPNGQDSSSVKLINGERHGQWTRWDLIVFCHENGQKEMERNLKDGEPDGLWTEWYWNGQKSYEGTSKDGEPDGLWTEWYENGQRKSEEIWKEELRIEKWNWSPDGQDSLKINYINGEPDGLWTEWYEDGQKEYEGTYKNGKRDGLWTEWYWNGQKKYENNYENGKEDGLHTFWYRNGQKGTEGTYKDGEIIFKKEWNEDGSVKE